MHLMMYRRTKRPLLSTMMQLSLLFVISLAASVEAMITLPYKIKGPKSFDDKIAVVGAGPSGVHMAYLLKQKGFKNVRILEKTSRIGGKVETIYHRNTPQDIGAIYLTKHFKKVYEVAKRFTPTDLVEIPGEMNWFDGFKKLSSQNYIIMNARKQLGESYANASDDEVLKKITEAVTAYIKLHEYIFGKYEGYIPLKPIAEKLKLIRGSFEEFLDRNKLLVMKPIFVDIFFVFGYSYIDRVPALYGLLWNSASLMKDYISDRMVIFMFKNGYQRLWKEVVAKEHLRVSFDVDILKMYRENVHHGNQTIWLYKSEGNKNPKWEYFDFLIWSPEIKSSMTRWVNEIPLERKLFSGSKPFFCTVSIVDCKHVKRASMPRNIFPENIVADRDNTVTSRIDTFAALKDYSGPSYVNGVYPSGADNKPLTTYITYQPSAFKRPMEETKKLLIDHLRRYSADYIKILKMKTWSYFPRYSIHDMETGILWKILEMQGKYGMWYVGSSVCFEAIDSVTKYNQLLIENMELPE